MEELNETREMSYSEAREKFKEVEILLSHRKPIYVDKGLDHGITFLLGTWSFIILSAPIIALSILFHPLFALITLLPVSLVTARMPIGDPAKGVSSVLQKIFLTKKQRVMTAEAYKTNKEYDEQNKIFKLYVQQKIEALKDEGVFEILHQGVQESYPWIYEETGEVCELSPQAWKVRNEQIETSNNHSAKENLRELLASNPDIIKSLNA